MSKLEKKYGAWIYTSDRGHEYTIGQITAEYNVIIDEFGDIIDLFDTNVLVYDKLITYFYGDMDDDDTVKYVDKIIDHYEQHQRKVKFVRDIVGRENTLYEVYLGTEEEKEEVPKRISCMDMFMIAKEDRLNFDIESFKEALYGAIENAEEEDVGMYELADLAVEYVEKKL
jgi:hypothetical protein